MDKSLHAAYQPLEDKLFSIIEAMMQLSMPAKQLAKVLYEAATDGKDQIRYLAGEDSKSMYARRMELGAEDLRKEISSRF